MGVGEGLAAAGPAVGRADETAQPGPGARDVRLEVVGEPLRVAQPLLEVDDGGRVETGVGDDAPARRPLGVAVVEKRKRYAARSPRTWVRPGASPVGVSAAVERKCSSGAAPTCHMEETERDSAASARSVSRELSRTPASPVAGSISVTL